MVRTQIQLTDEQARKLKQLAAAEGHSVAELIRMSVDALLATVPLLDSEESRLRALSIVGRFDGPPDLAAEHDRYLEEAYES
ncbi:MAG: ribbon-helix-helix protein, CopG family [Candidatus Promineofilum sp.]|jgi:16S rRNA U516 pseudouridylate synthase RsuA-like enzyme|nr:ribbon-helix-helix protein, CopG family [Promineifilum sp.]